MKLTAPSFEKNHDLLMPGLYAATDENGITTFDLRMKKPNAGDAITPKALHTIEHLLASVLRSGRARGDIVYFGPMGCRTGFYLITLRRSYDEVLLLLKESIALALTLEHIPGSDRQQCGNYLEHDLAGARQELAAYAALLNTL